MKTALYTCACLALLAVAAAAGIIGYQAAVLPSRVGADLRARGDATGKAADATRADLVAVAAGGIDSHGKERRGALPALASAADKIGTAASDIGTAVRDLRKDFAETQANLRGQVLWLRVMSIEPAVREYAGLPDQLRPALEQFPAIAADFRQQADLLGDCRANPKTCVGPRLAGALRAIETSAGSTHKITAAAASVAPSVTQNVAKISSDGAAITGDARKVVHRWASPFTWFLGAANKVRCHVPGLNLVPGCGG